MKIAITGATGYIGKRLLRAALQSRHEIWALTRTQVTGDNINWLHFDLNHPSRTKLPENIDVIFHLAAITTSCNMTNDRELAATDALLKSIRNRKTRFVFVSSQTARQDAPSNYGRTKWKIEQQVLEAGGVVVRPGQVFGGPELGQFGYLCSAVRDLPFLPSFLPVPLIQPIHVDDLAISLLSCIEYTSPKIFCIASPKPISFTIYLRTISYQRAKRIPFFLPTPVFFIRRFTTALTRLNIGNKARFEQLNSLLDLPLMSTASDIKLLSTTLRPLESGMSRSGNQRQVLVREGQTILRYLLREFPNVSVVKRYVRAIESLGFEAQARLPMLVHHYPALLSFIEDPTNSTSTFQNDLRERLAIGLMLTEATPQGAERFLKLNSHSNQKLAGVSLFLLSIFKESMRRLVRFTLKPVFRRIESHACKTMEQT